MNEKCVYLSKIKHCYLPNQQNKKEKKNHMIILNMKKALGKT